MLYDLYHWLSRHRWPAILWTLLILLACSWPGRDLPAAPVVGFDKIVHIGLFTGWSFLWLVALPGRGTWVVLTGIAYGIFLEFYQQWLPFDRSFDWWDAAADGLGVLIGYLLYYVSQRYFSVQ